MPTSPGDQTLTLLQVNDVHAYLEPHPELFWDGGTPVLRTAGGYARIRSVFDAVRREATGAVLALDNGDTFHGTYPAVHTRGEALIDVVNALALDAWTGHWDFAYGPDRLREIAARLRHPFLAANCYVEATGELAFPPFTVVDRGGLRVGIVGLAATIVDKTMPASFATGLRFTLGNAELPGHVRMLRDERRCDVVVLLSHLGFPQDLKLAAEVDGIDAVLSGHTHNRTYEPAFVNRTPVIQSGCHGSFVGRLTLTLRGGHVAGVDHRLIPVDEAVEPHAAMAELVDRAVAPHRAATSAVVGHTLTELNRNTMLEATADNLLLQAIAHAAGTSVAFSNGWRYGAPIPPGPVTLNDLWNLIPPDPPVSVAELTGAELWDMMEENLERTFAADPYRQMGGYAKRCLGVNLYVKLENPAGRRIQQFFVGGRPLVPTESYPVAFVTTQGVPERYGRHRRHLGTSAIAAMQSYLALGPVDARLRGTIVAV